MATTVRCPSCARLCRSDRPDAQGRLTCSACATVFAPGDSGKPTDTVSLGGIAIDAEEPAAPPTAVPVAASLEKAGVMASVTLPPSDAPDTTTTAVAPRKPIGELLRGPGGGKYVVDAELGRGGMGVVMRVVDRDLHRDVAMKVLLADQGERDRRRFVEEAQITGQLEHPNIVPVHDIGVDGNGRLFFTMKLVRGQTLADILDRLRNEDPEVVAEFTRFRLLRVFIMVCNAVAFAHDRGVVHRDLKPSNIMLGDFGEVQLTDWGLARVLPRERRAAARAAAEAALEGADVDAPPPEPTPPPAPAAEDEEDRLATVVKSFRRPPSGAGATVQGTVEGTPAYMPPEQARGDLEQIDERSDIYALGAILYELLTLRPPVYGRNIDEMLDNVVNHRIPPPAARAPDRDIPNDLAAIALKALSAEREHRYQAALDLRRDIEAHLEFRSVSARDDSALEMLAKILKRNRTATIVGIVSVAILAVVLTVTFRAIRRERDDSRTQGAKLQVALANLERERDGREQEQKRAAPALVAKARAAATEKTWTDAVADADLALRYDPALPSAHLLRAQLALHERDWAAASRGLAEYLARTPDDEDAQRLRGLCDDAVAGENSAVVTAIADRLVRMGMAPLAEDLFARGQERVQVYRKQLERAFPGCTQRGFWSDKDGMIYLDGLGDRADVADLTPLAGMPIVRLRIPRTKVIDLGPLRGMPLTDLDIAGTKVRDLGPLAGAPLVALAASGSLIDNLAPLAGMQIEDLDIGNTVVASLAPLAGSPLRTLRAGNSQLADLAPLAGMPLHELDLSGTPAEDLAPLAGARISTLRLSGSRVRDLAPLAGVPLTRLEIDRTAVADLAPVAGAHLRQIRVAGSQVSDLRPLAGMPLAELDLSGLQVNDLTPLAGMALASLDLSGTPVSDLAPLRSMRLTTLALADTKVANLATLKGLPLTVLDLSRCPVSNLAPLAECPLQTLILDGTAVQDLRPLARDPIREIRLLGTRVADVTPLATCPLERIILPAAQITAGLPMLRALPTLRQIGTAWDGSWHRVPPAKDFWREQDRQPR